MSGKKQAIILMIPFSIASVVVVRMMFSVTISWGAEAIGSAVVLGVASTHILLVVSR